MNSMSLRMTVTAVAGALLASCHSTTEPKLPDAFLTGSATGLLFTVDVVPTTIRIGQSATMTIHLKNPKTALVRLNFNTGCQVLPYISAGQESLVYPPGGGWACTAATSVLQIPAGGEYTRGVTILGGAPTQPPFAGAALSAGTYVAYAELADGLGRSSSVKFSVVK
jgi:hypothetical protein